MHETRILRRDDNQALALAHYALDFLEGAAAPSGEVLRRVERFHLDSVGCGIAALATRMPAPTLLRAEAHRYPSASGEPGATCFGSSARVKPEKAVLANSSAVRELDANGTNFGYNPATGYCRGEFGHNDFYPVAVAGCQVAGRDGRDCLLAMLCLDEIRGRLAEVFGLKDHSVDHVLHGAIASAAVYGALLRAKPEQIESAIGLLIAHYVPFRAIRAGHQLSDSKGASAAISSELAVLSVCRAIQGFVGPRDVFRNPKAIFRLFEGPADADESPFDLELSLGGDDFAIMGMHFKLGIYEHQSAGALEAIVQLVTRHADADWRLAQIRSIEIEIYEPAFSIIGDPAKRDPRTRQSADHSMVYIVAAMLRKVARTGATTWSELTLMPHDYDDNALFDPELRALMDRIEFRHGGPELDALYPDGIPTRLTLQHAQLGRLQTELVMYPHGHARNQTQDLAGLVANKFVRFAGLGVESPQELQDRMIGLSAATSHDVDQLYQFPIQGIS